MYFMQIYILLIDKTIPKLSKILQYVTLYYPALQILLSTLPPTLYHPVIKKFQSIILFNDYF